jgi:hypothetical protein
MPVKTNNRHEPVIKQNEAACEIAFANTQTASRNPIKTSKQLFPRNILHLSVPVLSAHS